MDEQKNVIKFSRKVVAHGNYSLFLNIPRLWATHTELKKGNKVSIHWNKDDDSLILKVIKQ